MRRACDSLNWGVMLCLLLAILAAAGCRGCDSAPTSPKDDKAKKKAAARKPDFEQLRLSVLPNEASRRKRDDKDPLVKSPKAKLNDKKATTDLDREKDRVRAQGLQILSRAIKPGHWTSATLEAKANNFDFVGELEATAEDVERRPITMPNSPYYLEISRAASLPKGQTKFLELSFFVPEGRGQTWLGAALRDRDQGRELMRDQELLTHMPSFQYYFFVMARKPEEYRALRVATSIKPPVSWEKESSINEQHYRPLFPPIDQSVPLPSQPLQWTSIAYVLWDDVDPKLLSAEQQQAMVDWLHWGGQLVISGPHTLDALRGSFLAPYLPAASAGPRELTRAEFADDFLTTWGLQSEPFVGKSWSGVKLLKLPEGRYLPGCEESNLAVYSAVGRGRIVVTAFRLSEPELLKWPSFDSFLNNALMARPARKFSDPSTVSDHAFEFVDFLARTRDPLLSTRLRYFTRDFGAAPQRTHVPGEVILNAGMTAPRLDADAYEDPTQERHKGGAGCWNDDGVVSSTARTALRHAAGIKVPERIFVLKVLGGYLAMIVPLNWLVFRLIGRVEWAWIAAPLIAVGAAFAVIMLAQLDIGFSQARNELVVVELQTRYARAHVTRFSALYSSLSNSYAIKFKDPSAVAQPFAPRDRTEHFDHDLTSRVDYRQDQGAEISGFRVSSNSTGMVHSEYMLQLDGGLELQGVDAGSPTLVNHTQFKLRDVLVLDALGVARIDELPASSQAGLRFDPNSKLLQDKVSTQDVSEPGAVNLAPLVELAKADLEPGETRLLAAIDGDVGGVDYFPSASTARVSTLLVAHLRPPMLPELSRDQNLWADVKKSPILESDPDVPGPSADPASDGQNPPLGDPSSEIDSDKLPKDAGELTDDTQTSDPAAAIPSPDAAPGP